VALDTVEKTGKGRQIGFDGAELLAHPDDHRRLGDRAIFLERDHRREQVMARPTAACRKARAAALDELLERTTKP